MQWKQCDRNNFAAAYMVKSFNVSATYLNSRLWTKVRAYLRCLLVLYDDSCYD